VHGAYREPVGADVISHVRSLAAATRAGRTGALTAAVRDCDDSRSDDAELDGPGSAFGLEGLSARGSGDTAGMFVFQKGGAGSRQREDEVATSEK
jgi:hypothetical protein